MEQPVDLTNLRSMTDGDPEMEKALFEEFISTFDTGIGTLQHSLNDNEAEIWRREMHALKGVALNLGAEKLGEFCRQGQEKFKATPDTKVALLKHVETEYARVKAFVQTLP